MAATLTTLTSNITAPVNFVLMRGLLSAARKRLPYFNGTLPGRLEKMQGSASVKWRRIENLAPATTALSEQTGTFAFLNNRSTVQPTVTDVTVAIAKYGNALVMNEEVDLINVNSRSAQLMDTMGANAGESLNILMRTDYASGATTIRYAGAVSNISSLSAAVSLNDIKYCVNQLNRNSAMKFTSMATGSTNVGTSPVRASYYGICHPDVEEDIRSLTGFVGVESYGGYTQTEPGEFGAVGGVRWCSTEIALISTDIPGVVVTGVRGTNTGLHDVYDSYIYGKEAVGSIGLGEEHAKEIYEMYDRVPTVEIIKKAPGQVGGDLYNEVSSLAWKSWYAGKVLNANWIIRLRTLASSLS